MGLFDNIFGSGSKSPSIDLPKPYCDLLKGQTDPVVRGVLTHAIEGLLELQSDDMIPLKKKLEIHSENISLTAEGVVISALKMAASHIMIKSSGDVFGGEDLIIKDFSGDDSLKKASAMYVYGLIVTLALRNAFIDAGILAKDNKKVAEGELKANLVEAHVLASTEQKKHILIAGEKMFAEFGAAGEAGENFINDLWKLTLVIAVNWEKRQFPEEKMVDVSKKMAAKLLGALN
jgi:hypothetical protein